jgi:hypothetical protein
MRKHSDSAIVNGIETARKVWNAAPDTVYLAGKFGYKPGYMLLVLQRLEQAGLIRRAGRTIYGETWIASEG